MRQSDALIPNAYRLRDFHHTIDNEERSFHTAPIAEIEQQSVIVVLPCLTFVAARTSTGVGKTLHLKIMLHVHERMDGLVRLPASNIMPQKPSFEQALEFYCRQGL